MGDDVAIDRSELAQAKFFLDSSIGGYSVHAEDGWARDTGIGNPCGRVHLRVALENALGAVLMRVRTEVEDGLDLSTGLQTVIDSFAELDASLGRGWDRDYDAGFP
ncbi:MAG: hypothetical protein ABWY03_07720 [Microbacterium sp.]